MALRRQWATTLPKAGARLSAVSLPFHSRGPRPIATPAPRITIVVPTFKAAESLPNLIDLVAHVRKTRELDIDLVIVDDNSRDGSVEIVRSRPETWVQVIVRTFDRGLSQAVLEGLRRAHGEILVCMDADVIHGPDALPQMLAKLEAGADFVLGSRYVVGRSTSDNWGFFRWLISRVATWLARPLTAAHDPMGGYFALRRSTFETGRDLNPIGDKIALELIVKCGCERVVEVPVRFEDRRFGTSKITLKQQLLYLQHLRRLYIFKFGVWTQLMQFLVVGGLGTIVNLSLLTILLAMGVTTAAAIGSAIVLAMCFNFALNRRFSFSLARHRSWVRQFFGFGAACSVGVLINYLVTLSLLARLDGVRPQTAALAGIAAGTAFNFLMSRYLVFRMSYVGAEAYR
jgi:dolichol-phosphate mannosyltransferase